MDALKDNPAITAALDRIGEICQQLPEDVLIHQMARLIARVLPNVPHVLVMIDTQNDVTTTSNIQRDYAGALLIETGKKLKSEGLEIEDVD